MTVIVRKWGNSLGMIIPTSEVSRLNLSEASKMEFEETVKGFKLEVADEAPAWMKAYAKKSPQAFWNDDGSPYPLQNYKHDC